MITFLSRIYLSRICVYAWVANLSLALGLVRHVEDKQTANNFSFKCHRKDATATSSRLNNNSTVHQVWAVNDIKFHKQHGTFATAGSDGV